MALDNPARYEAEAAPRETGSDTLTGWGDIF